MVEVARLADRLDASGLARADRATIHFVEHHRAHLASAFFASPFDEAAVVSIDGFGDFSSVMWGVGRGQHIEVKGCVRFPHSLGQFYTAFTQLLGFPKYGDEYKMMGLSAYGRPRFAEQVRDVVRVEGDQVRLNLDYFVHHSQGVEMTWDGGEPFLGPIYSKKMVDVFGPARGPRTEPEPRHADLAASVQLVLEECYFALLNAVYDRTRTEKGLPGRRGRAELRRQRDDLRSHAIRRRVHPAGRARRGHVDRRRPSRLARGARPASRLPDASRLLRPRVRRRRDRARAAIARARPGAARRGAAGRRHRPGAGGGQHRRVVSGTDGVRSARARRAQHPRRSAPRGHEGHPERAHQAPRAVPAVLPVHRGGSDRRILRDELPVALHGAGLQDQGPTSADGFPP